MYTVVKILNYLCSLSMFMFAIFLYAECDSRLIIKNGFFFAFSSHLFIFGIILGVAEYDVFHIFKYIEFLIYQMGKGFFLIFIGVLMFNDNKRLINLWASSTFTLVGVFNLIISCFPVISDYQDS